MNIYIYFLFLHDTNQYLPLIDILMCALQSLPLPPSVGASRESP